VPNRAGTLLAVGSLLLLSACATDVRQMTRALDSYDDAIELTSVPFYAQTTDQCGPAALATILNVAGVDTTAGELRELTYIPARQGSLQAELLATTRRFHRLPYRIDPTTEALVAELEAGRPVLVLQNLGTGLTPIWHYAVVVGYLPEERRLVLRSGKNERHLLRSRAFLRSWKRAEYWGFVALTPGEMPTNADRDRYLRTVAALETIGDVGTARHAYETATRAWPDYGLAWLALGNAAYAAGDLDAAREAYATAVNLDEQNVIALNNLAQVYFEQGCVTRASSTLEQALALVDSSDPYFEPLQQLLAEITAAEEGDSCAAYLPWKFEESRETRQ
jgi:tetratricopeptide (TPR) repeat protein